MRIRIKTLFICVFVAVLAISMIYFISQNMLMQRVQNSESEFVESENTRVHMGLSYEYFRLGNVVSDWANWDDTYQFVEDNNTEYVQTNLVYSAFNDLNLNVMMFVNLNGTVIMAKNYNLTSMTEMSFDSSEILSKYPTLIQVDAEGNHTNGIVQFQEGPMLVSSAPILTSDYQGPSRGWVIFGRFLDNEEITFLSNIVGLPINLRLSIDQNLTPNFLEANNSLTLGNSLVSKPINETLSAGYSFVKDLNEKPIAIMQVLVPRVEYTQARESLFNLGVSLFAIGCILVVLMALLLDRFVLSRLSKLSNNVRRLSLKGEQLIKFEFHGNDEISHLAEKINTMVNVIGEAQADLKDYSVNLEKKVDEKTKELVETQKKLVQAERLSVIGQMAAVVGHDLRNPLFGIKTAMHYLRKTSSNQMDENGRKMLDLVDKNLESANKILNDLLDYSREIKLEKEVHKLEEFILESILSARVPEKVQFTNSVDKSVEVNVDPSKIKRVFINLISNAVEAMPNGGLLTIQSALVGKDLDISFTDTGTGISPENMNKIMKPLFTTKTKGIGLGLVICKRFVEAHGGSLTVTSEGGKGTTFTVSLPVYSQNIVRTDA